MVAIRATPGFWLRMVYAPEMVQYGCVLRLHARLYVLLFIGAPLRAALQALEFTVPIFWSYLVMTAFSFALAVPMAKWLRLDGVILGLLGTQIVFQGIVAVSLIMKSNRVIQEAGHNPRPSAIAK